MESKGNLSSDAPAHSLRTVPIDSANRKGGIMNIEIKCSSCALLERILECGASQDDMAAVLGCRSIDVFEERACLFEEGQAIDGVHCMHEGEVLLLKRSEFGGDHVVCTVTAGELLGTPDILIQEEHANTAQALSHISACFIPKGIFLEMTRKYPGILMWSMQRLSQRLVRLDRHLDEMTGWRSGVS